MYGNIGKKNSDGIAAEITLSKEINRSVLG
jgi:hypothetical protein